MSDILMQFSGQMVYAVGANKKANGPSVTSTQPALSNGLFGQPAPVRDTSTLLRPVQTYQRLTGRSPFKASMTIGVYWIYQTSKDRAVYVGSSNNVEVRMKAHAGALNSGKHGNPRLRYTWNKYGQSDFQFLMLEACGLENLIEREQFWMDALSPVCNVALAAGNSMRGTKMSDDHKQKISASNKGMTSWLKGKSPSPEHREKISATLTGRKHSAERRKNISEAHKGQIPWSKGKTFSAEYRQKLSDAKKGKPAHNKGKRKNK